MPAIRPPRMKDRPLLSYKYIIIGTRTKSVSRLPDKIINKRAAFTNSIKSLKTL